MPDALVWLMRAFIDNAYEIATAGSKHKLLGTADELTRMYDDVAHEDLPESLITAHKKLLAASEGFISELHAHFSSLT